MCRRMLLLDICLYHILQQRVGHFLPDDSYVSFVTCSVSGQGKDFPAAVGLVVLGCCSLVSCDSTLLLMAGRVSDLADAGSTF